MLIARNRMNQAQWVLKKIVKTINIKIYVIIDYNFNLESLKHEQIDFFKETIKTFDRKCENYAYSRYNG